MARRGHGRGGRRGGRLMAGRMPESPAQHDEESRPERVNRELIELLNELRVALPGVQVLFAFLLAVPFSAGYSKITPFQRDTFFVTLAAPAVSTPFFIAPSPYHPCPFPHQQNDRLPLPSN